MDDSAPTPALQQLAAAHRVATSYWGHDGVQHQVTAATLVGVLAALGVDASSPARVDVAIADAEDAPWRLALPSIVVARLGASVNVPVHVADGDAVRVWVELETGGIREAAQVDLWVAPRTVDGRLLGRATFALPSDLPLGYHTLHAEGPSVDARCPVVVSPQRLELPSWLAGGDGPPRAWGFMTQLYSVRSQASWGVGDLVDLGDLAWLSAHNGGADFVLVNPLHAAEPVAPMSPSPYLPTSRRFVNPLYIRVEAIPEAAYLTAADRSLVEWSAEPAQALTAESPLINRDAAWEAKRSALDVVYGAGRSAPRQARFDAFREAEGRGLEDFALWCALTERYGVDQGEPGGAPSGWPAEALRRSPAFLAQAAEQLADRVSFYCWLQWIADEQLAQAQASAVDGGMRIGVMHDLAVGVHPHGSDIWSLGGVMATGATVGAPPDMYNQQGQNWSQPPWHPGELARVGYQPYRDLLRSVLRHAGAVRIDHVIGLFRLWWIPAGGSAAAGAYVHYDHEALIGILALEAHRAGCIVIGEDLGVFEPWVRDYLAERGVLGTSILWFEKDGSGSPIPPEQQRRLALASVTTHDLPPTAGYLADEHVALRQRLGLLTEPVETVRRDARREREAVLALARERGLLGPDPSEREVVEALHRLVLASPAVLVGVSLVDAVGERRTQNQPGTFKEYPNWEVPLGDGTGQPVLLDELFEHPRLRSLMAVMAASRQLR